LKEEVETVLLMVAGKIFIHDKYRINKKDR